ncbi:MAG: mobilization relaxase component [Streptosporangiaceae bacterium]|nr:mobilization relaxase component [Streptosporangiaceae bacterium]
MSEQEAVVAAKLLDGFVGDEEAVRWVAVRHADDHIHIVATFGAGGWGAAGGVERRVPGPGRVPGGGGAVRPADGSGRPDRRPPTAPRGEREGQGLGWAEEPRIALRRHVITAAGGARDEAEFFARLQAENVLVRKRFKDGEAARSPGTRSRCPRRM